MRRLLVLWLAMAVGAAVAAGCSDDSTTLEVDQPPLVYVALGESTVFTPNTREGVIYVYRDMLAEDFGMEVDFRDHTQGGLDASTLVYWLQSNEPLRRDLAEADVVTMLVPKTDWLVAFESSQAGTVDCGGDDGQQCWRDAQAEYEGHVDAIFAELTSIVDPSETMIRAQDEYMFRFGGTDADVMMGSYWQVGEEYVEEVAAGYGIPVAQVFDEFHGSDGIGIPCDRGLLQSDCQHPTAEGARLMAKLIRDLGYELAG